MTKRSHLKENQIPFFSEHVLYMSSCLCKFTEQEPIVILEMLVGWLDDIFFYSNSNMLLLREKMRCTISQYLFMLEIHLGKYNHQSHVIKNWKAVKIVFYWQNKLAFRTQTQLDIKCWNKSSLFSPLKKRTELVTTSKSQEWNYSLRQRL